VAVALRGLVPAASVPIEVTDDGIGRASEEVEAALYFCAAEAVQNAVKHAAASRVSVHLSRNGDLLELTVSDDGAGFDDVVGTSTRGLGNMRDRIDAVGGSWELRTSPGNGVEVLVSVPATGPVTGSVTASATEPATQAVASRVGSA
jgi:signal transduction histidine kinase